MAKAKRPKPCRECSRALIVRYPGQKCICNECQERRDVLRQADDLEAQGQRDEAQALRSWADILKDIARKKGGWFPGEEPKDYTPGTADDAYLSPAMRAKLEPGEAPPEPKAPRDWTDLYARRERNKAMRAAGLTPPMGRPPLPVSNAGVVVAYRVPQEVRAKLLALGGKDWLVRAVMEAPLPEQEKAQA